MKKWLVIITLALLLTGCGQKQETDVKKESPSTSVEISVEPTEVIESEASEETNESQESTEVSEGTEESEVTEESEITEDSEEIVYPWEQKELFPTSSVEEIPTELLEGMSVEDLERARYEIFWRDEERIWYDEKELNPIEQQNVEKIKVLEGQKRLVAPVPTTDIVFFECYVASGNDYLGYGIYLYISDGDMYYCYDRGGSCIFGTFYSEAQIKKYTELRNITRLKTFNRGTDVNPCPCIITEEGEVYWVGFNWTEGGTEIVLEKFEFLEDYQVDDILLYDGEWRHRVEVLLKDGSIIYLESEPWG